MRANTRNTLVLLVTTWVGCGDDSKDAELAAMKAEVAQLRTEMAESKGTPPIERVYVEPPPSIHDSPTRRATRKDSAAGQPEPESTALLEQALAANPATIPSNTASGTVSDELRRVLEEPTPTTVSGIVNAAGVQELRATGEGTFDSNIVVSTIKTRIKAIQACYERELRSLPNLAGRIAVEFTVQPRGTVTDARISENAMGNLAVAQCVLETVQRFRFNPGPEGGSVSYSYPFVFAPEP